MAEEEWARRRANMEVSLDRMRGLGMTPRECLIDALASASDDARARAVVDALDDYLQEGPDRVTMREDLRPNHLSVLDGVRAERDAALARAERAERELQQGKTKKSKTPKLKGRRGQP